MKKRILKYLQRLSYVRSRIDLSVENFDSAITRILKTTFKTL